MGLRQKAVKGVAWSATQNWGSRAVSFVVTLVLARLVLPEAFGLIAYATVFTAFIQIFVDQGFSDAIVQCQDLERGHLDTAFWVSLLTSLVLTIIGISASGMIAGLFNEQQLTPIIRWLSVSFIFSSLSSVQQAILKRNLAFKSLAIRSLIATSAGGAAAIIIAALGYGVWSLVAKILMGSFANVIVLWRVSDWRPGFNTSRKHFTDLFSFGINIVGSNFVDFFSLHGDDFLIGYFLGPVPLGYYTLAYNLLTTMSELLIGVPNSVIFATFSRLQSEYDKLRQSFYEVAKLQSIIAFPIFLGISAIASEVILFLYGQNWSPSIPVLQLLMIIGIYRSASYFYSSVIKAVGKPSWRLILWSIAALLNVFGFFIAVKYGIVAVAAAYVIVCYLVLPLYFLVIKKLINISMLKHLKLYIPALVSSLSMVLMIHGLKIFLSGKFQPPFELFIYISVGAVTYLLTLWIIQPQLIMQLKELAIMARARLVTGKV